MKCDKKVKELIEKINVCTALYLSSPNTDAYTDCIVESIINKSKELEHIHESRFKKDLK